MGAVRENLLEIKDNYSDEDATFTAPTPHYINRKVKEICTDNNIADPKDQGYQSGPNVHRSGPSDHYVVVHRSGPSEGPLRAHQSEGYQ